MVDKEWPDVSTLFLRFSDLSVSRNMLSKSKNREICEVRAFDFLNCESTYDLSDIPASIMIENWKPNLLHYPRQSTMSQFRAIAFLRPKYANLAHREPTG